MGPSARCGSDTESAHRFEGSGSVGTAMPTTDVTLMENVLRRVYIFFHYKSYFVEE